MKKYLHDRDTNFYWKYVLSISRFINYLYCWIYEVIICCRKHWIKFFRNQLELLFHFETLNHSFYFTCSHSFWFAVPLVFIPCHSLSFVITRYHSLPLVVICCHSLYYSLSLVVFRCTSFVVTCCHLLSLFVPIVVTCCLVINDRFFIC